MRRVAGRIAGGDNGHEPIFATELGKIVRDRRQALRLSQQSVVDRMAGTMQQAYLSKIELGEYLTVSPEKLAALAAALDLDAGELTAAQERLVAAADDELTKGWAVSANPWQDLARLAGRLQKPDVVTLVRMARVLALGRKLEQP